MKHFNKFSTILAVLAIGFFSIYADNDDHDGRNVFESTNHTQHELNITINLKSGDEINISIAPGHTVETNIAEWSHNHFNTQSSGTDQVSGITYNGQNDPAGSNAVMQGSNGNTVILWQMSGSSATGFVGEPATGTLS